MWFYYYTAFKEEWLRGLKRRSAKSLYRVFCIVGSNPTSSVIFIYNQLINNVSLF